MVPHQIENEVAHQSFSELIKVQNIEELNIESRKTFVFEQIGTKKKELISRHILDYMIFTQKMCKKYDITIKDQSQCFKLVMKKAIDQMN